MNYNGNQVLELRVTPPGYQGIENYPYCSSLIISPLVRYYGVLLRKIEQSVDTDKTILALKDKSIPKVEGFECLRSEVFLKLLTFQHYFKQINLSLPSIDPITVLASIL